MNESSLADLPLRDIHLPEAVSWWPIAPGWWLLLFFLVIAVLLTVFLYRRHKNKRSSPLYLAGIELESIRHSFQQNQDKRKLISDLSSLLRRTCLALDKRSEVASITGQEWLSYLDKDMPEPVFSQEHGKILVEGPYRPDSDYDVEQLIQLCEQWLSIQREATAS